MNEQDKSRRPKLYTVATPIGNLSDMSPRALETLQNVRLIAAEDTRVTGRLLRHFGIRTPMTSLHRHNESGKAGGIVARMVGEGMDAALTTDAGTPAISDPGHLLVKEAWEAGIEVLAVAGPSAVAAALSVSGFDARAFAFYGFLPREKGDLRKKLLEIARGPAVAVAYESPHRVTALVESIADVLPGCMVCVCCDLTKLYEKTLRGTAGDVLAALQGNPKTEKGEYCVVLDFANVQLPDEKPEPTVCLEAQILYEMLSGSDRLSVVEAAVARGVRRNDAKRAVLRAKEMLEKEGIKR